MKIAMLSSKKHAGILIVYLIYVEQYDHVFVRTANKTDDIDLENIDKCVHFIISIYPDAHIDFYGDELLNTNIQLSPLYRYIYTSVDCKKTLPKIDNKFFYFYDPIMQLDTKNSLEDALRCDPAMLIGLHLNDVYADYFFLFTFYKHILIEKYKDIRGRGENTFIEIDLALLKNDERFSWPDDKKIKHMYDEYMQKYFGDLIW